MKHWYSKCSSETIDLFGKTFLQQLTEYFSSNRRSLDYDVSSQAAQHHPWDPPNVYS